MEGVLSLPFCLCVNPQVTAVCTMGRDPVAVAAIELLQHNLMPSPGELRQGVKNSQDVLDIAQVNKGQVGDWISYNP